MVLATSPDLEQFQSDRLEIYDLTDDPHPSKIFNLNASCWFKTLLRERIDSDRYNCTYLGSYMFAEVSFHYFLCFYFTYVSELR